MGCIQGNAGALQLGFAAIQTGTPLAQHWARIAPSIALGSARGDGSGSGRVSQGSGLPLSLREMLHCHLVTRDPGQAEGWHWSPLSLAVPACGGLGVQLIRLCSAKHVPPSRLVSSYKGRVCPRFCPLCHPLWAPARLSWASLDKKPLLQPCLFTHNLLRL